MKEEYAMIDTARKTRHHTQRLALSNGAVAGRRRGRRGDVLELRSEKGELIFEYDAATGRSRILAPTGDLELCAQQGDVNVVAGRSIRLQAAESVEVQSGVGIRLRVASGLRRMASLLCMNEEKIRLASPALDCVAERGHISARDMRVATRDFAGSADTATMTARHLETSATTLVQKARDMFHRVEGLLQTRAGRSRTVVDGTCHVKSAHLRLRAEKHVSVDGESIHLG
jgi:hypothetical protein